MKKFSITTEDKFSQRILEKFYNNGFENVKFYDKELQEDMVEYMIQCEIGISNNNKILIVIDILNYISMTQVIQLKPYQLKELISEISDSDNDEKYNVCKIVLEKYDC